MIETVTMERSTFAPPPARFEAGTPPIAEAVGLGAAVDYLTAIGMEAIAWHEKELTAYALEALPTVPGLRIFGPPIPVGRGGTISFDLDGIHPHDVGQILDGEGVQVRVGHHCARPTCVRFGVPAMTRVSLYLYNTTEEIDALVRGAGPGAGGVRLMQFDQLYQEIILDHYKKPRGRGLREPVRRAGPPRQPDLRRRDRPAGARGRRDGRRRLVRGHGLFDQPGLGQRAVRAGGRQDRRRARCPGWTRSPRWSAAGARSSRTRTLLEDGVAFAGVAKYPARVKCALLSWMAFKDATAQAVAGGEAS